MKNQTYFVSNKSTKTIGGVQTIMRLIEEAFPNRHFTELPFVDNEKDDQYDLLPNVEMIKPLKQINELIDANFQELFKMDNTGLLAGGSQIIVFGVQKLLLVPDDYLAKNEVIIFQSTRPDLTFGLPNLTEVPLLLQDKVKHINKFVTFTEEDKKVIKEIIDHSDIQTDILWFTIPNPSKTERKKLTRYTKNVMYLGRFDFFQKNVLEYAKVHEKLPDKFKLNMYGYGAAETVLKTLDLNVMGKINDISEVADQNSVLLLLSQSEGFGNVLVEAMSVGMPIIVYDSYPAAHSIVTEGVGKLIPYGETDQVIDAIQEILQNEETFKQFSENAYQEAKKYQKKTIVKQYQDVLGI